MMQKHSMAFPQAVLRSLWLLLLVAVEGLSQACPASPEDYWIDVTEAVCAFHPSSDQAALFRSRTRADHGVLDRSDS